MDGKESRPRRLTVLSLQWGSWVYEASYIHVPRTLLVTLVPCKVRQQALSSSSWKTASTLLPSMGGGGIVSYLLVGEFPAVVTVDLRILRNVPLL
jgi:hypothetical protein